MPTQSCRSGLPIGASHPDPGFSSWTATKLPMATSPNRPQPVVEDLS